MRFCCYLCSFDHECYFLFLIYFYFGFYFFYFFIFIFLKYLSSFSLVVDWCHCWSELHMHGRHMGCIHICPQPYCPPRPCSHFVGSLFKEISFGIFTVLYCWDCWGSSVPYCWMAGTWIGKERKGECRKGEWGKGE